ncbi:DUF4190 domain-containing protein [Microbacterium stercoris]|uniref:DUF4190 domain-containing protein n=1 Tax=Microbacterium stercoris TaxID=2820289 RepID=A0A939TWQ6_9MICO|nr:DUF4190 domain-containing protein [Microbacterium stercoris]MBO3662897.1 hypothetical protein [Microbacterium stercoris]
MTNEYPSAQPPQYGAPQYGGPQYGGAPAEDPGKTLGIVGFILAFVFALAGLIVSIIARNKSKAAGYDNQLAKWGIIVSIILLVLGVIGGIFAMILFFAAMAQYGTYNY